MEKRHYSAVLAVSVLVALLTLYLNSLVAVAPAHTVAEAIQELSASRYADHVKYLEIEEMKGRGDGTPELDKAADYIAGQFRLWGLRPMGDNNTYFQKFELTTGATAGPHNEVRLNGTNLKRDDDFVPILFSSSAEFDAPLIFVGYGITAPELHYDDYQGVDATGKIAIVLRHEPQEADPKSPFDGTNFTRHASFVNKAINAKQHGARGIIFITDMNHADEEVGSATRTSETDDLGIAAVHAKRESIISLLKSAGKDIALLQKKVDVDLKPESFEQPTVRVHMATDITRTRKTVRNVAAGIMGTDQNLRNEWVLVGAHYD